MFNQSYIIKQYQEWNNILDKKRAVEMTIRFLIKDVVKNGITVIFRGKTLHFHCLKKNELQVGFYYTLLEIGNYGKFIQRENKIQLNVVYQNDAAILYKTINHEFKHKVQYALAKYLNKYKNKAIHYQYLNLLKHEVENGHDAFESFSFKFTGNTYISGDMFIAMNKFIKKEKVAQIECDVVEAFYRMQLMEREAFDIDMNAVGLIDSKIKDVDMAYKEKHRMAVSKYFNLGNTSYEEICALIDIAKENIIFGKTPSDDIEAAFTYKIAALLNAQNDPTLEEGKPEIQQYLKDCSPEITAERLQNSYNVSFADIRYK